MARKPKKSVVSALTPLSIQSMDSGDLVDAINRAIRFDVDHCRLHPNNMQPRRTVISISTKPGTKKADNIVEATETITTWEIAPKLPTETGKPTVSRIQSDGTPMIDEGSLDNPNQTTIGEGGYQKD